MTIFGEGDAGRTARWIADNEPCRECGGKAGGTVDFDWPGLAELTQIATCEGCRSIIVQGVLEELKRAGKIAPENSIGRNGRGRA